MSTRVILRSALALALLLPVLVAQEPRGLPPCERFIPNVPGGSDACVAVLHASDGLLYTLTEEELLSFDGARWLRYELPGARTWTALADRARGGVYLGGDEEIGIMSPDADEVMTFQSLLMPFPSKRRSIGIVTTIFHQDGALYFSDEAVVGRLTLDAEQKRGVQLTVLGDPASRGYEDGAHYLVAPSKTGKPYVIIKGKGICRWTTRGPQLIPGGDLFPRSPVLYLQEEGARLLVVGHSRALDWLEDGKRTPFLIEGRDKLVPHVPTGFCEIPGLGYAMATNKVGVLIFDIQGRLLWHLDQEHGLGTSSLYISPTPDRQGGLWVPLESGVMRVGLRSAIRIFDRSLGLEGEIRGSCWHQGSWYVITSKGIYVYRAPKRPGRPGRMQRVDEWTLQFGSIASDGDHLILTTDFGLMRLRIDGDKLHPLRLNQLQDGVFILSPDKKRLWAGGQHGGVEEFSRDTAKWKKIRLVLAEEWTPHAFSQSADGLVYVLVHTHSEDDRIQVLEISGAKPVRMWGSGKRASPALSELRLYAWRGKVWLQGPEKLHQLMGRSTVRVGSLDPLPMGKGKSGVIAQPLAESSDRYWFLSKDHRYLCMRQQDDQSWARWNPFRGIRGGHPTWFQATPDGRKVWMGNREIIAVYKEPSDLLPREPMTPMIQDLEFLDGTEIFHGYSFRPPKLRALAPREATFRIRYSLPAFGGTFHRVYQTRMSGLDEDWTSWRRAPFREFSSLPAGQYRFEVRALDELGSMSAVEGMDILVLKHWHATWWAILGYVVLGIGLIWGIVRLRTGLAEKRIQRLEDEIRHRELAELEKSRLEEQLRQAQRLESLGRMAGGVAHDFNNILTAILGHAELVREDASPGRPLDPKSLASVEEIMKSGRKAADLTHRLLAFSRKQVLHPRVVEINEILDGLKLMLSRLLRDDIEMLMDLDSDAGKVRVDPGQIEQVILNLVLNACDAMPDGGKLEVGTRVDLQRQEDAPFGTVTISVRDNGTGIEAGILEEIFEPFFTTKPVGEGTGLGLSSALGIVEQSGGTLVVSSEPGQGTLFEITFARLEAGQVLPSPMQEMAPGGSGERVLLVDDDESVRSIAKIILSSKGYEIFEASSGPDACRLFASEQRWHLLITDMIMPGMNGRELARQLRDQDPHLPVLYLSGYSTDLDLGPELGRELSAFLQKPFHSKSLLAAVRVLLDKVPSESE